MISHPLFFYLFAGLAIACSLLVILKKNPVASALNMVVVFFAFAGIYAMLDAHLLAALQILVYAGAIMVLFIFVIMLLNADAPSFDLGRSSVGTRVFACLMMIGFAALLTWAFKETPQIVPTGILSPKVVEELGGNTRVLSEILFSEYVYPFELTSVLLLAAIVGTIAVAKRRPKSGGVQ